MFLNALANSLEVFLQPLVPKLDTRVRVGCGFGLGKQRLKYFKLVDNAGQRFAFAVGIAVSERAHQPKNKDVKKNDRAHGSCPIDVQANDDGRALRAPLRISHTVVWRGFRLGLSTTVAASNSCVRSRLFRWILGCAIDGNVAAFALVLD